MQSWVDAAVTSEHDEQMPKEMKSGYSQSPVEQNGSSPVLWPPRPLMIASSMSGSTA